MPASYFFFCESDSPLLGKKKSVFQDLININLILGWCLTGGDA